MENERGIVASWWWHGKAKLLESGTFILQWYGFIVLVRSWKYTALFSVLCSAYRSHLSPRDTRTWLSFSSTYWKENKLIRRPSWVKSFIMIPVTILKWFFYPFTCMSPFSYYVDAFSKMQTAKFNTIIQFFTLKYDLYVCPGKLIKCWSPIFFKFQKEILWLLPWPL